VRHLPEFITPPSSTAHHGSHSKKKKKKKVLVNVYQSNVSPLKLEYFCLVIYKKLKNIDKLDAMELNLSAAM
jgi:hypothetical protein